MSAYRTGRMFSFYGRGIVIAIVLIGLAGMAMDAGISAGVIVGAFIALWVIRGIIRHRNSRRIGRHSR